MEKLEKVLSKKNSSLSSSQKDNIRDHTTKLETRQNSKDDPSLLPSVTVNDIEKERFYTTGYKQEDGDKIKYFYHAGTNGIDYTTKVFSLVSANLDDLRYSNFFSDVVTSVGVGEKDYESIQKEQSLSTGGIGLSFNVLPDSSGNKLGTNPIEEQDYIVRLHVHYLYHTPKLKAMSYDTYGTRKVALLLHQSRAVGAKLMNILDISIYINECFQKLSTLFRVSVPYIDITEAITDKNSPYRNISRMTIRTVK